MRPHLFQIVNHRHQSPWIVTALAGQPGAVSLVPALAPWPYALFVAGSLWLGLWRSRARLAGLAPALAGVALMVGARAPDVLISGDARSIGVVGADGGSIMVLSDQASRYGREVLRESAGVGGDAVPLPLAPGAACNRDFCRIPLARDGRQWVLLMARNANQPDATAMAGACSAADIVVVQVPLATPCHPRLLLADGNLIARTGGIALDLRRRRLTSVAMGEAAHPWWPAPGGA